MPKAAPVDGRPTSRASSSARPSRWRSCSTRRLSSAGPASRRPTPSSCACSSRSVRRTVSPSFPSTGGRRPARRCTPARPEAIEAALEGLAGAAARAGLGRRGRARRGPRRRGQRRPAAAAHRRPARHVEGARRRPRSLPLFTALTGEETPEAYPRRVDAASSLRARPRSRRTCSGSASSIRSESRAPRATNEPLPFRVSGGEPRLRDVYPVLVQPPAPGSLSGWIGRYAAPAAAAALGLLVAPAEGRPSRPASPRRPSRPATCRAAGRGPGSTTCCAASRPKASGASGSTRSSRSRSATSSSRRTRRSWPRPARCCGRAASSPAIRCCASSATPARCSAVALFPFGLRLPLVRRPGTNLWEGRFLVPEGLTDGRYTVRILLRDASGASGLRVEALRARRPGPGDRARASRHGAARRRRAASPCAPTRT